ncbi:BREX-1 system phosphatase PglZ type A [Ligilactobacillus ceti]|uniref:Uncharacterized protein n=1 Tax=Ligilactobacillus ceti DSM 22408 TaxID=1122146 RepID=A0A0R2KHH7_9LACO|nr:BREX-1 system phosphatase PglZ type A [Ligilactobacillus ceti]KRN88808.1 hypothetical protein IV53_GL000778 [Ligilactobacillus ceti DSM 22408]
MDLNDITKDLNKKFAAELPEFYNRRIVIWMDQEQEFEDLIDEVSIENVKVLKMTDNNKFFVKKTLCFDDTESDYLLYCPIEFKSNEDNWITDIFKLKGTEDFRADRVSIEIAEMGLDDYRPFRKIVKQYKKFFNAKKRREDIKKLSNKIDSESKFVLAIMSVIANCEMIPATIIREVIKAGLDKNENSIYQEMKKYDIDKAFWELANQGSGYHAEDPSIKDLFVSILLTASLRNIDKSVFDDLDKYINIPQETFCFEFVEDWIRDTHDKELFKQFSKEIAAEINLYDRLKETDLVKFENSEAFEEVDEAILYKLLDNIANNIIDTESLIKIVENRRVMAWHHDFEHYYEGIYYMAKMKEFYNQHQQSFHEIEPQKLWENYANDFYIMDTYYRKFQRALQESLTNHNLRLDDVFKRASERAEGIYKNWFLDNLLNNWCNIAGESLEKYGYIPELNRQVDFYQDNIKYAKTKMFVIISDAMRYEVGVELAEELKKEMQCQVEMNNMEGIFPTITPFGMAALLPKKELSIDIKNDNIKVLADQEYTDSNYREKILKKANDKSVTLKYDDLIQMKRDEKKALVKGMDVVYIYHDRIDEAGHGSGNEVFSACDVAISELKNLVRIIVNDFSGVNIMITADHGFIYTYNPFTEEDKIQKKGFDGAVAVGRRYAVMNDTAEPDYLMPVKIIADNPGLKGFTPRENSRIKKQGGGINFVHGGISLQEMMVPLISYKHLRNASKTYQENKNKYDTKPVELKVLSNSRKISNMIFKMSFYQSEMVSVNRVAANFTLYFVDEYGSKISDEVRIIADRKNVTDDTDRKFDVSFNLKTGNYNSKNPYYLMIIEESNQLPPEKIEFSIDIPFPTGELDFFS